MRSSVLKFLSLKFFKKNLQKIFFVFVLMLQLGCGQQMNDFVSGITDGNKSEPSTPVVSNKEQEYFTQISSGSVRAKGTLSSGALRLNPTQFISKGSQFGAVLSVSRKTR